MNIDSHDVKDMTVEHIVLFLGQYDEYLIRNTVPSCDDIEIIRDELLMQYNKLTGSNIMLNK